MGKGYRMPLLTIVAYIGISFDLDVCFHLTLQIIVAAQRMQFIQSCLKGRPIKP